MTQHRSVVPLAMFYMINITTYQYFIYFTSPRDEEGSSLFQCEGVKSFTQFRWNAKRKTKRKYIGVFKSSSSRVKSCQLTLFDPVGGRSELNFKPIFEQGTPSRSSGKQENARGQICPPGC